MLSNACCAAPGLEVEDCPGCHCPRSGDLVWTLSETPCGPFYAQEQKCVCGHKISTSVLPEPGEDVYRGSECCSWTQAGGVGKKEGVYLVVNEFMLCCFSQMQVFAEPLKAMFNLCSICNLIRFWCSHKRKIQPVGLVYGWLSWHHGEAGQGLPNPRQHGEGLWGAAQARGELLSPACVCWTHVPAFVTAWKLTWISNDIFIFKGLKLGQHFKKWIMILGDFFLHECSELSENC